MRADSRDPWKNTIKAIFLYFLPLQPKQRGPLLEGTRECVAGGSTEHQLLGKFGNAVSAPCRLLFLCLCARHALACTILRAFTVNQLIPTRPVALSISRYFMVARASLKCLLHQTSIALSVIRNGPLQWTVCEKTPGLRKTRIRATAEAWKVAFQSLF